MTSFPKGTKPEDTRAVDVSIEIDATIEEVWPYLSTSEGLSAWYVDAKFSEEKAGATCTLTFGPGMVVPAHVQACDVNVRVRLGAPPEMDSPRVEEYRVSARDGGGCIVRIVNWGFGEGAQWDAEYEAVRKGWLAFLSALKPIAERFGTFGAPRRVQMLSTAANAEAAWSKLKDALGDAVDSASSGARITLRPSFAAPVSQSEQECFSNPSDGTARAEPTRFGAGMRREPNDF